MRAREHSPIPSGLIQLQERDVMRIKVPGLRCLGKLTTVTLLCFCILWVNTARVCAQKAPSIFKTENGDKDKSTSATNMAYINSLESEYKTAETSDKEKAKLIRNKLIHIGVEQVDTVFGDYRKKSRKRNDLIQFLFDFLEIGASTAIAITNGERAKSVIAEALTGFKGARTAANKGLRLLENQILFNKMVSNRALKLAAIYDKLNQDVVSYPWERARSELGGYFIAGTIDDALNSLSIATGSEAKDSETELKAIMKRAGVLTAPSEEEVRNSRATADAIDALADAYANADATVTDSDNKIADANKRIADADKTIADENGKPNPDSAKIAQANQDKTKAGADKTQAVTAKEAATKARDTALSNLKGTYEAIAGDAALSPLLDGIPDLDPGYSADFKARLKESLKRLKEKKATTEDYALIMLQVGKAVRLNLAKDPTLNKRLQTILKVNK